MPARPVAVPGQGDLRAEDGAHPGGLAGVGVLDRAVEPVPVGQGQGVLAQGGGALGQCLRRGRAVEKTEMAVDVQMDEIGGALPHGDPTSCDQSITCSSHQRPPARSR